MSLLAAYNLVQYPITKIIRMLRRLWSFVESFQHAGGRLPWTAAFVLVVLPAVLLFLSNNRTMGTADTWPVMPTAYSLATEGNWDQSPRCPSTSK